MFWCSSGPVRGLPLCPYDRDSSRELGHHPGVHGTLLLPMVNPYFRPRTRLTEDWVSSGEVSHSPLPWSTVVEGPTRDQDRGGTRSRPGRRRGRVTSSLVGGTPSTRPLSRFFPVPSETSPTTTSGSPRGGESFYPGRPPGHHTSGATTGPTPWAWTSGVFYFPTSVGGGRTPTWSG